MKRLLTFGLIVVLVLALGNAVYGQQTIHVPADPPTIQAGLAGVTLF